VVWGKTSQGKNIPFDPKPVFGGAWEFDEGSARYLGSKHDGYGHECHFGTCRMAGQYRRDK
jgi:hypothetical protein